MPLDERVCARESELGSGVRARREDGRAEERLTTLLAIEIMGRGNSGAATLPPPGRASLVTFLSCPIRQEGASPQNDC